MLTGISNTTASSATGSTTSGTSTGTGSTDMNAAQDRFLKLLVAQLNNQDPMNPVDNAQMTSQMAQINTVTGIQQVNDTLKSMAEQFTAMQVLQGSNMVGHNVLVADNTLTINNGKAGGAIDLAAPAESVKVDILSPGGQVIDTLNLGALGTGRQTFSWDASNYSYSGNPTFQVTATAGGQTIANTSMARATVQSVSSGSGVMNVQLAGRSAVAYSAIQAIL